jgi:FKBP-type peptidyl-prolyl cis-trans isomerase
MINKQEAVGIFVCVAVLALMLAFWRFGGSLSLEALNVFANNPAMNEQGAVVIGSQDEEDRRAAIEFSASADGTLERLIIEDVKVGGGDRVAAKGDTLVVDYIGTTQAGVQFDSSYVRGEPFEFTIGEGRVIEGWEKGTIGMRVGGERILVIPSSMAYGNRQVGPIPPNSPLVFSIKLLEIK